MVRPANPCSPDTFQAVFLENRISRDNGQAFFNRLSNDQTVEGITMVKRQSSHAGNMPEFNPKLVKAVRRKLLWNERSITLGSRSRTSKSLSHPRSRGE